MTASWWWRACCFAAAIACLGWVTFADTWRGADHYLVAAACLPLALSAALLLVGSALGTAYQRFAIWCAIAVLGQASSLQLIDAGPRLHYQHHLPIDRAIALHPWLVVGLTLQAAIVTIAATRCGLRAARSIAPTSGPRILVAIVASAATAATVSPDPMRFVAELGVAAFLQILSLATVALAILAVPSSALSSLTLRLDDWLGGQPESTPGRADAFGWTAGLLSAFLAAVLAIVSYERHPHVPDEVAYLLHAGYFAQGMFTMPAPPVPAAFDVDLMSYEPTRWFSPVPPGWPAVLAAGVRVGAPWLVNPILTGVCVWLTYVLLRSLYSRRVGRYATLLLAFSPWVLFLGMSYMTHMLTLVCVLVAAVGVMRARQRDSFLTACLAGAGIGAASLIRPLDGLLLGACMGIWAVGLDWLRLRKRVSILTGLLAGTLATGALVYPYNRALTGEGTTFPINSYNDKLYGPNSNAYGFGKDRGLGWGIDPFPGHGPIDAIINTDLNAFGLNTDLFGWSAGSLLFVSLIVCAGGLTRVDRSMIGAILLVLTGYFFYYFSGGPDFGARYWFPIVVPLVALTARGIERFERTAGPRALLCAATLTLASLVTFVPWRAVDKYWHFRGMRGDVRTLAGSQFAGDLVLIAGSRFPDYASAVILNPADLRSTATVYAWDRDLETRLKTLDVYRNREVWLINGPSRTGSGYRIVEGPVPAKTLIARGASE